MVLNKNKKWNVMAVAIALTITSVHSMAASPDVLRSSASLGVSDTKVKSYREWKSEKVQDALQRVTVTKTQLQITKSKDPNLAQNRGSIEAGTSLALERLEAQLQADQNFLETVKNFGVPDYLAGYVLKLKMQNKKEALNEVAGKLTAEEIAELMSAYATSAFGSPASDLGPSANSTLEDKVR